jgi:hypothetical protein
VTCPLPLSIVIRPPLTQRHALTTSSQKIGEKSRYSDLSNAARTGRGGTLCNKESSATTWRKKHQEYQDGLTEAEDGREYDDYYDDNEADTKAAKALAVIDHACDPEDDYHPPEGESAVQRDAPPDIALPTKKIAKVKTHGVAVLKQKRLAVIKNSGLSMSKKARKQRKHRRAQWPRLVADAKLKVDMLLLLVFVYCCSVPGAVGAAESRCMAVGDGTNSIAYSEDNGETWSGLGRGRGVASNGVGRC